MKKRLKRRLYRLIPMKPKNMRFTDRMWIAVLMVLSALAGVLSNPNPLAHIQFSSINPFVKTDPVAERGLVITPASAQDLASLFDTHNYTLENSARDDKKIPPIFISTMPKDLHAIASVDEKKELFIRSILPLVLLSNERISKDRARLLQIAYTLQKGKALSQTERDFLDVLYVEYETTPGDIAELIERVDIVPPSLALAQAAEESGWGTSRFAQMGNALYGQQVLEGDEGILPLERVEGRKHYVRSFDTLYETVASYTNNLNSHRAYGEFRKARAEMRRNKDVLNPEILAKTLVKYSERGEDYVKTIKRIMRINDLAALDAARLDTPIQVASDLMI